MGLFIILQQNEKIMTVRSSPINVVRKMRMRESGKK